jgi:hypothetical protein
MRTAVFYLTDDEIKRLDELRGLVPRSRMGAITVRRLIADIEGGRVSLLPEMTTAMATIGDRNEK